MHLRSEYILPVLLCFASAQDSETPKHGEGEEGTSMGPVAFLWPADRTWNAANDNTGPCGSPNGPSNRTTFPLTQGSVALSVADEAWHVAFRVAFGENPTQQSDFDDQVVSNISEIDPGHQCYKLNRMEGVQAGTNATIQLEYWSEFEGENNGKNQSFFACADVTFVEDKDFTIQVPCFNVTSADFNEPTTSANPTASSTGATQIPATAMPSATSSPVSASSGSGLSTGAKAGIAVGSIIGALALLGLAFFLYRRGKTTGLNNREEYELRTKKLNAGEEASARSA